MGLFNYSSSPLSSIMPQSSPYQPPNYANAFKMNMQPQINNLQFKTGLLTSGSLNPITALNGKTLMNDAINQNNSQLISTSFNNQESSSTTSQGLNMGFQALGQIGEQTGGVTGQVMQGASKLGTSIKGLTDASKTAGGFKNLSGMEKAGGIGAIVGAASDMIGSFMPEKTEYSGDKGNTTQTMDSVYDGIADAAMSIPGWGTLVGGIMKGGKLLGQGVNALGGGTDGMCVCAGTKVFKANGEIVNIENLKKEDGIIGWDEDNKQIAPQLIHDFIEPREKECVEITLKNGITLKCSFDHPIYNGFRFIPAYKLKLLSKVAVSDYPKSNTNIKYIEVVSIESIGMQIVYNLQADNNHTYLANCIITHNTTTDAILGSSFLNLTPLGLINGFGGAKTDTITKDKEAFAQVGSSYTGSNSTVDDALKKSGKKYGLLSRGAMNKANAEIADAKRQQSIISDISEDVQDRMALKTSMSAINGNRRDFLMRGGYDQASVRVGRRGMSIELLNKARSILKAQKGSKLTDPFQNYLQTLPKNQQDTVNYRVKDYWEFNGKPKDFNEAVQKGMFTKLPDGWHARSVAENPNTGEIEYMKSENHPTRYMESDWYEKGLIYNDDGTTTQLAPGVEGYEDWKDFTSNYELQKTSPYWKYVRRKTPIKQETPQHRNGGSIIELVKESIIELVNPATIPEFQNGGSINVIPDGALHARKHNMEDADNLTKKGIPVVDNKGEQQAEIEKNEIIFRLEVTQKLEELEKKYYDKDSSQKEKDEYALEAGELLVKEILHNTDDKTGLINTLK